MFVGVSFAQQLTNNVVYYMLVYQLVNALIHNIINNCIDVYYCQSIIQIQLTNNNSHITYQQIHVQQSHNCNPTRLAKQKLSRIITGTISIYHEDTLYCIVNGHCFKLFLKTNSGNDCNDDGEDSVKNIREWIMD